MMKDVKTINVCLENEKVAVLFVKNPEFADLIVRADGSFIPVFQKENSIEEVSVFKSKSEIDSNSFDLKKHELTAENVSRELKEKEIVSDDIETQVSNFLLGIGIPAHLKGYKYSRRAILLIIEDQSLINLVTKELYPKIAGEFKSTSSRVERAIRHSIEVAFSSSRGNFEFQQKNFKLLFSYEKARPTNSEFLSTVAEYFRLKNKK